MHLWFVLFLRLVQAVQAYKSQALHHFNLSSIGGKLIFSSMSKRYISGKSTEPYIYILTRTTQVFRRTPLMLFGSQWVDSCVPIQIATMHGHVPKKNTVGKMQVYQCMISPTLLINRKRLHMATIERCQTHRVDLQLATSRDGQVLEGHGRRVRIQQATMEGSGQWPGNQNNFGILETGLGQTTGNMRIFDNP